MRLTPFHSLFGGNTPRSAVLTMQANKCSSCRLFSPAKNRPYSDPLACKTTSVMGNRRFLPCPGQLNGLCTPFLIAVETPGMSPGNLSFALLPPRGGGASTPLPSGLRSSAPTSRGPAYARGVEHTPFAGPALAKCAAKLKPTKPSTTWWGTRHAAYKPNQVASDPVKWCGRQGGQSERS